MKRWRLGLALLCVCSAIGWYLLHASRLTHHEASATYQVSGVTSLGTSNPGPSPVSVPPAPAQPSPAEIAPTAAPAPGPTPPQPQPALAEAASLPPSDLPGATVLENMRTVFRSYTSMFGGNPVGTNPEITRALNGDNPKHARFINPDSGLRINGNGELVDAWGTPFFFHQLSGTVMEIHSAGPDRKMWTADDLVTK